MEASISKSTSARHFFPAPCMPKPPSTLMHRPMAVAVPPNEGCCRGANPIFTAGLQRPKVWMALWRRCNWHRVQEWLVPWNTGKCHVAALYWRYDIKCNFHLCWNGLGLTFVILSEGSHCQMKVWLILLCEAISKFIYTKNILFKIL